MNLANKLTVARVCMVPFYILFMELGGFYNSILALLVFSIAAITDFFDGKIARENKTITSLGIFLDPLADKLLISAAFICFVDIPMLGITAWMVIAIIAREFLITGLRSIAAYKNMIIPADKSGKFKTTSQMIVIITIMVILIVNEAFLKFLRVNPVALKFYDCDAYATLAVIMDKIPFWATLCAAILTIVSGVNYVWKYRKLLDEK
ncbi:MAG: CDP-diacylglycerol--glycerol-3-phosphate 3-phosphatidyltransferase [Endomicrobium sp.]|nr:CDP-diacylglycerol--glycerol-3-phosphate 3-phosphatidyltransferase [Endomicrobium sp.]